MKIALTDDHSILSSSIANMLLNRAVVETADVYETPNTLLDNLVNGKYDILILDIMLPEMNGIDLLETIKSRGIETKVLFLTSIKEVPTIKRALRMGANGYLCKDCTIEELQEALMQVASGETYIGAGLRDSMFKNIITEEQSIYHLTPREKEVLQYICEGHTIKEAAFKMNLSYHTVQSYQKAIMRKFKQTRTVDLIVFAINNGLYHSKPEK